MELDTENRAALQALQSQGPLGGGMPTMMRPRGFTTCPHCREGFGSASFAIHVRRCRALLPTPESEFVAEEERKAAASAPVKPIKPEKIKPVQPLVDLCLRFIFRNFQTVCMDRIASRAEEEAALIDSIPTSLVHRIIVNLVHDAKQSEEKDAKRQAKMQAMKAEVASIQRENVRLESFRQQTVVARARLREQEQISERLRKSLDVLTLEMAAAETKNQQLRSQYDGSEKQQHRQEAKINSLSVEMDSLKAALKAAQKKETEAIKKLASFTKNANIRSASTVSSKPAGVSNTAAKRCLESSTSDLSRKGSSNVGKRLNASVTNAKTDRAHSDGSDYHAPALRLCMRPRADSTKIPLPTTLSTSYLQLLQTSAS